MKKKRKQAPYDRNLLFRSLDHDLYINHFRFVYKTISIYI
ncbi:hypothetical protein HMPREF1554_00825 [Porphyromonas gingivalis F0569]|nr:hypothetical protein HMPREF1554_00825 [Porphyromonas gingivalis F0569]ERJ83843.1 hypothetical protein HMPREF1988_00958 [Porphyromonas gingivalis F0185]